MVFLGRYPALLKWFALLLLIPLPVVAGADQENKTPPPPPKKAAAPPAHPQQHPPQQNQRKPGPPGNGNAAHPGAAPGTHPGPVPAGAPGAHPAGAPAKPGVVTNANGTRSVTRADGRTVNYAANGRVASVTTPRGAVARYDGAGRVATIHTPGMTIHHAPMGRTVVAERRDARGATYRVVSVGGHRGYVERGFVRGGQPYMRRTYVVNGRVYTRVYGGYPYRGVVYYHYVPAYYYSPGFYGWAYRPWGPPVAYAWGWGPWYASYGYYFTPYPTYAEASFWLTDFVVASTLQAAYEAQAAQAQAVAAQNAAAAAASAGAAGAPPPGGAPVAQAGAPVALSPEVKQQIADEVRAQLAAERDAAAAPPAQPATGAAPGGTPAGAAVTTAQDRVPAALDPNHRTFIVSTATNAEVADGTECSLSPGDVLTRIEDTPNGNQQVKVLVSSSQTNDCRSGTQLALAVDNLQDMANHFRSQMDDGLGQLAQNQGKNGLPTGPAAGAREVPEAKTQPDLTAVAELQKEEQEAEENEKDVAAAKGGDGQ